MGVLQAVSLNYLVALTSRKILYQLALMLQFDCCTLPLNVNLPPDMIEVVDDLDEVAVLVDMKVPC